MSVTTKPYQNLQPTSGFSIYIYAVISLPDAPSYDQHILLTWFLTFWPKLDINITQIVNFSFTLKETRSVTMNIFPKKNVIFKSFVKMELSDVFTINMFSTAESCMEQWII